MKPGLRKLTLSAHLTFSVGWIGTVVSYLALGLLAARWGTHADAPAFARSTSPATSRGAGHRWRDVLDIATLG